MECTGWHQQAARSLGSTGCLAPGRPPARSLSRGQAGEWTGRRPGQHAASDEDADWFQEGARMASGQDGYHIECADAPDDRDYTVVGKGLHAYNIQHAGETGRRPLCLFLHAPAVRWSAALSAPPTGLVLH